MTNETNDSVRRWIALQMHRLAWWLDRRADDLWNVDDFLSKHGYVK